MLQVAPSLTTCVIDYNLGSSKMGVPLTKASVADHRRVLVNRTQLGGTATPRERGIEGAGSYVKTILGMSLVQ